MGVCSFYLWWGRSRLLEVESSDLLMGVGFEGDVGEGVRELQMYEQSVGLFCVGFYEGVRS